MLLSAGCALGCLPLVLTGCGEVPPSTGTPSASPSPAFDAAARTTTHDNVVATRKLSAWMLHAVPMPPDARHWHHSPTAHYRHGSIRIGPSDDRFSRTTWWTVPLSRDAFTSWLRTHAPHGLRADPGSEGAVQSSGVWEQDQDFGSPSTMAHTEGWVNFAFLPRGVGLVVRVDTFVGARFARTVVVPEDTSSVTIRRTQRSYRRHAHTHTTVRTVTGPRAVAHLVEMLDHLPGAMTAPFVASCPFYPRQTGYSMTFSTPHGSYVASLPTTSCWPSLMLTHDGTRAGPPLDPGRVFATMADHYLV